jgi:threonine dehydratase
MSIALKEIQNKLAAVGDHLTTMVGNTPLVRLQNLFRAYPNITVAAKLEWFNPGGSVKDRPALNMIREGERTGQLNPDKIDHRCDEREYRHCVCTLRCFARLSCNPRDAL